MDPEAETKLFGDPDVIETPHGVIYHFRGLSRPSLFRLKSSLIFLVIGTVPASAAVATGVFLIGFGDQLPWYSVALPCLFILQTGLVAALLFSLTARYFSHHFLFEVFGRHELELRDGRLFWGRRAGRFRQGYRHAVADLRCLAVSCYTAGNGERQAHFGVEPVSGQEPTYYCLACDEREILALAHDLHSHLRRQADVPLRVTETTADDALQQGGLGGLTPAVAAPWWTRWYVWRPWHFAGTVGLAALFLALRSLDLAWPVWVYFLFLLGFAVELAMIKGPPKGV